MLRRDVLTSAFLKWTLHCVALPSASAASRGCRRLVWTCYDCYAAINVSRLFLKLSDSVGVLSHDAADAFMSWSVY